MLETERRKFTRYEASLPVTLFDSRRCALGVEPDTVDISVRGLGLQVSQDLNPGDIVWFRLDLPDGPILGKATVRWTKPHYLGYRCGAQMESLSWLQERRLRLYMDPDSLDAIKILDWIFLRAS